MRNLIRSELKERIFAKLKEQRLREIALLQGEESAGIGEVTQTFPDHDDLAKIRKLFGDRGITGRATFIAEDLFLRKRVEPLQAMFSQWMERAAAQVNGENIPFREIITWCQNCDEWGKRRILAREALALCRFLAPFSHATWQALLAAVLDELGYENYVVFCEARRGPKLHGEVKRCRSFLKTHRREYMKQVEEWLGNVQPGHNFSEANRFDAIYLLGMRYMDAYFPSLASSEIAMSFFDSIGIKEGPQLKIHGHGKPGSQSFCIPVSVPSEVHIFVSPICGWLDWEALFHEMGHAFYFLNTSSDAPLEAREFLLSGEIPEAFAFLFQRLCMKKEFLESLAGNSLPEAEEIERIHGIKFKVLTRRYGAKFLIEYENFSKDHVSRGQGLYAEVMERETGFKYDPETYLFDLMPDFYSLDYFKAFLASEKMLKSLEARSGPKWFLDFDALETLKNWASCACLYTLDKFMAKVVGAPLQSCETKG